MLRFIQKEYGASDKIAPEHLPLIASAFQYSAVQALIRNVNKALEKFEVSSICLAGGVAANKMLREEFEKTAKRFKKKLVVPAVEYCGDNAAMIAYRGLKVYESGLKYSYDFNAYPSLSDNTFIKEYA